MKALSTYILFFCCFLFLNSKSQFSFRGNSLISPSLNSNNYMMPTSTNTTSKQSFMLIRRPNNFDEGLSWFCDMGFSGKGRHLSFNLSLAWQTYGGWEFGLGLGGHINQLDVPVNNENGTLEISGAPIYGYTKYFLANFFEGIIKPYGKLSMGYCFNSSEENVNSGNGILFENGLGIQFKIGDTHYLYGECNQYNHRAKGTITNPDDNLNLNYKVWFNDLVFRIGYGRRLVY